MTDTIQQFFDAWGEADAARRRASIAGAMADGFVYADPRSDGPITTLDALATYVGQFTDSAPGWSARVVQTDGHGPYTRAVVAFVSGGAAQQHGTYMIEMHDGKIVQLIGFVGAGGLTA